MLFELLVEAARSFSRDRASSMGAALAYYTMLSIAPTVLIVVSVVGLVFGEEAARGEVVEQLRQLVGDNGANAVEALLERMNRPTSGILGTVGGLLAMIIGATTVFSELQASLDKVWQAPEQPKSKGIMGFVRTRLLSLSLVLSFGFLILVSLLASAAFYSLYAILQTLNGAWLGQRWLGEVDHQPLLDQPYRALGLTAHPNTLGLFLMVGILAGLALLRQSIHTRRGLALVAGSLLLSALGLLTTASRVALLTAGIGFALVVLFLPRPMLRRRRERLLVLGAMALVLAFGLLISDLPRRIADTVQTPSKILDRLNWELTNPEAVIRDAPILGVGAHNLPLAIQRLETLAVHNLGANSYLVIWGELGIIGLGLFIAAAVSVIGWMRPRNGATLFTLGCALLGVFVAFMLDAYYLYPGTRLLMFWVLGVWWGLALQAYDRAVVELSLSTGAPESVARNSVSHSSSGRTTPGH